MTPRRTPPAIGSELSLRERLTLQVIARAKLPLAEERAELEDSLLAFVEAAWPSLDPSRYQPSWVADAMRAFAGRDGRPDTAVSYQRAA